MQIKVLVENTPWEEFEAEHGLALYIEHKGKQYLVDSGASGLYASNAKKLGVDLAAIDMAFLSHAHYDHASGYPEFFAANTVAPVYLQDAAKRKFYFKIAGPIKKYIGIPKGVLEEYQDRFCYVEGYKELENAIYILPHSSEGLLERAKHTHMCAVFDGKTEYDNFAHEQTIIFRTEDGLVCFNSCSHAGVDIIIEEIKRAFPEDKIKAFVGGFHMMGITGADSCSYKKEEVCAVAEKLLASSDAVFYSGHCTGTIAFSWLKEVLGERLVQLHTGKTFEV